MQESQHHLRWLQPVVEVLATGETLDARTITEGIATCDSVLGQNPASELARSIRARLEQMTSVAKQPEIQTRPALSGPNDMSVFHAYLAGVNDSFTIQRVGEALGLRLEAGPGQRVQSYDEIGKAVRGLQRAELVNNDCYSRLLIPKNGRVRGVASLIQQEHPTSKKLQMSPKTLAVNAELFRMTHTLVDEKNAAVFFEGPPYDFRDAWTFQQDQSVLIPGTAVPLFSPAGQKLLCTDPEALRRTMQMRETIGLGAFDQIFLQQMQPTFHGVERPESHQKTSAEMMQMKALHALTPYEWLMNHLFVDNKQFALSAGQPRTLVVAETGAPHPSNPAHKAYSLNVLIRIVEEYCNAQVIWAGMHARREGEVFARMEETVETGIVPHVVYGASHSPEIIRRCMAAGLALLVTNPRSLEVGAQHTLFADERNPVYISIRDKVLPTFRKWSTAPDVNLLV